MKELDLKRRTVMYIYLGFFDETDLLSGKFNMFTSYFDNFKRVFPDSLNLNLTDIKMCIGFLKKTENELKKCMLLKVKSIITDDNHFHIEYVIDKELDIASGPVGKAIYKFARQAGWVNDTNKFSPNLCIFNKEDFDLIRKGTPNIRKISTNTAIIEKHKEQNNWNEICQMFEPLEMIDDNDDIWNNSYDLYIVAYACSKLGEPQNGMERDRNHLNNVKKYRDLSIKLYKRCTEIDPQEYKNYSALAYRHYLNVLELTKPKGRRDGQVQFEIAEALKWLDKALAIFPGSIKDNFRKGKLIIDKQIGNFKNAEHVWGKDTFDEIEGMEEIGIKSLENVIFLYQKIELSQIRSRYSNEYVKTLYTLGCFYLEKSKSPFYEYACCKLANTHYDATKITYASSQCLKKAKEYLIICLSAESDLSINDEIDIREISNESIEWAVSSVDKFYRIGQTFLQIYFVNKVLRKDLASTEESGKKALYFLESAKSIAECQKLNNRVQKNTSYINDKIAWCHILSDNYDKASSLICNCRESYIKNTYAVATMLSGTEANYIKAEEVLKSAVSDNYNLAKNMSMALLAFKFKINGEDEKFVKFINENHDVLSNSAKSLVSLLDTAVFAQ